MKVFIDEDTGAGIGRALRQVYVDSWHVGNTKRDRIRTGTHDDVWIPIVAADNRMILSRNVGMLDADHERQSLIDNSAAVVFLPQHLPILKLLALILKKWDWLEFIYEQYPVEKLFVSRRGVPVEQPTFERIA